jgi:hypothetical protein
MKTIPMDGTLSKIAAFLKKCLPSTNNDTDITGVDVNPTASEVAQASSSEPNNLPDDKAYNTTQDTDVVNTDGTGIDSKSITVTKSKIAILRTLYTEITDNSDSDLINYVNDLLDEVDLYTPPGIAGEICRELELYEQRPIKEIRPLVAFASLSMINHKRSCYGGGKLTFQGLGVASSAAGKEAHLTFTKLIMEGVGLADKIASKPKSDKSIYLDVLETEQLLYSFDEAHSFFKQATNKNASAFEAGMVSVLLEVCTSEKFYLPSKTRDELLQKYEAVVYKLAEQVTLTATQGTLLDKANRLIDRLKNGWKDPFLSLVGYSTPINMDIMINEHNIEQGLIGRFIFLRAPEHREKMTWRKIDGPSAELISKLQVILESDEEITIDSEAKKTLDKVFNFFELNEHLNHPQLGAIYARGTRWVMLIASLLASEKNIITDEHIRYATKLFMYNIQSCEAVLYGESGLEEALLSKAKILALRYTSKQDIGRGELASKMVNCCTEIAHYRKKEKNICHVLINQLIADGVIIQYGTMIKIAA